MRPPPRHGGRGTRAAPAERHERPDAHECHRDGREHERIVAAEKPVRQRRGEGVFGDDPPRLGRKVGVGGAHAEVASVDRQEGREGERQHGREPDPSSACAAPEDTDSGEDAERSQDGGCDVDQVRQALQHEQGKQPEGSAHRRKGGGGDEGDERQQLERRPVRRGRHEGPDDPLVGEQGGRPDDAGEVRSRPAANDDVHRGPGEREPDEERHVDGERRVAGGQEHRREQGQGAEPRRAVEQCARRRVEDVGVGDAPGRGQQRVALVREHPSRIVDVVHEDPGRAGEGRRQRACQRPGEPRHAGEVEGEQPRGAEDRSDSQLIPHRACSRTPSFAR